MRTRVTSLRRWASRRRRPPRFPRPGYLRGAGFERRRARSRASWTFMSGRSAPLARARDIGGDVLAATVTVAGIFLWGGFLFLLGG